MKVGNTINGMTVTDVKRVNKLNLIQFLKEVDNYLQQGYQIDVNSARQVGLVLMADVYKVQQPFGHSVGSTDVNSTDVGSVGEQTPAENVLSKEAVADSSAVAETTSAVETSVEPVEDVVTVEPVTPKKTTTRSKKTTQ